MCIRDRSDAEILFVHIREPEAIMRFREAVSGDCKTVLVQRPVLEQTRGTLGNRSDDGVKNYTYDGIFVNDGALEELPEKVYSFFKCFMES